MTALDRINRRLAKEAEEREIAYQKHAPEREERFKKMDDLLARYDEICSRAGYSTPDEAKMLWRHLVDEYPFDLIAVYRRARAGKPL